MHGFTFLRLWRHFIVSLTLQKRLPGVIPESFQSSLWPKALYGKVRSIIACGLSGPAKTIGNSQYLRNAVLSGHAAHALRRNVRLDAHGCDKERIPGSATKNSYDAGVGFNSLERSLGNPNYWRASTQGIIEASPEARTID